jgi:hypothetical protein
MPRECGGQAGVGVRVDLHLSTERAHVGPLVRKAIGLTSDPMLLAAVWVTPVSASLPTRITLTRCRGLGNREENGEVEGEQRLAG